ncbi:hypothetical protein GE21DRAFT_8544 [Neurospora crassa]|uniref:Uncharacterized protein n=2 Tax=Neurospora crassa TaxID=5141 RepID=Q1K5Y6_NEUCR|nr:hypothetical protein NCU07144 [Neurospora crassa OR74A]EAA28133.1 hypothetical protein NCU07144 [Neurospora crassa OR74A]KHE85832.1 hypothetical protein GE21DRAFT_8544 [Neurospora crassa]CAD71109.1 related to nucleolar phosphoprotein nopp140 [Neurospora crassa]|eukprot:XP_957369.1 hypothetical protein NCU07144 [Neurospora crassa OR74A]
MADELGFDQPNRRARFDSAVTNTLKGFYDREKSGQNDASEVTCDVFHAVVISEMYTALHQGQIPWLDEMQEIIADPNGAKQPSPEYQAYRSSRIRQEQSRQMLNAILPSRPQRALPSSTSTRDVTAQGLSSQLEKKLTLTEGTQPAAAPSSSKAEAQVPTTDSSSRKEKARVPIADTSSSRERAPAPTAVVRTAVPLIPPKPAEKPKSMSWADLAEEDELEQKALTQPGMAESAQKGKATATQPAPKPITSTVASQNKATAARQTAKPTGSTAAPRAAAQNRGLEASSQAVPKKVSPSGTAPNFLCEEPDAAGEAAQQAKTSQQTTMVYKGLAASRHAPPATDAKPKKMSFGLLDQRQQLASKHSQQKADQESVLQQQSLQNQLRQYKKPDFTLSFGERRKLWALATPTVCRTHGPFELTLPSADWCYKHCMGDRDRIIHEFTKIPKFTGLVVYFEDDFTKLIVGPRKQIPHQFRQATADRMWDLWVKLANWINQNPELTMSRGLHWQLDKEAEKRTIEANAIMASTTDRPSAAETRRQQFTQTVGAQDEAKASLQKRVNEIWAHLSRDTSRPVDATEAQTAMTQFLQKELSSKSVLTAAEIKGEVEFQWRNWMWMHAENKRQCDAAAKREQAKGKGKAGT